MQQNQRGPGLSGQNGLKTWLCVCGKGEGPKIVASRDPDVLARERQPHNCSGEEDNGRNKRDWIINNYYVERKKWNKLL